MASQVKSLSTTKLDNALDISDLTHLALNGNGVLDKFLTLHRLVLDREFNDGRIQGKEYSDSFVATYAINMELAIKFLLEKEKQFYEIELIESQIANSKKDLELKAAQISISLKELEIKTKELAIREYELANRLPAEVEGIKANTKLSEQKVITEKAQTDGSVIKEGSVIGWNIQVLEAQVKGIDQDAKQKIMRMLIDTWTTRMNNDSAETEPAGLGDSVIAATVQAAKDSVGI